MREHLAKHIEEQGKQILQLKAQLRTAVDALICSHIAEALAKAGAQ